MKNKIIGLALLTSSIMTNAEMIDLSEFNLSGDKEKASNVIEKFVLSENINGEIKDGNFYYDEEKYNKLKRKEQKLFFYDLDIKPIDESSIDEKSLVSVDGFHIIKTPKLKGYKTSMLPKTVKQSYTEEEIYNKELLNSSDMKNFKEKMLHLIDLYYIQSVGVDITKGFSLSQSQVQEIIMKKEKDISEKEISYLLICDKKTIDSESSVLNLKSEKHDVEVTLLENEMCE